MTTYVLVPGACHGGWWYDPLVGGLRERGCTAVAVTLRGLAAGDDLAVLPAINLDSHLAEVADVVAGADDDVVLVGHSYAGSVITGVADRLPERVRALVYLDAFVPGDGDSCWAMTDDEQRRWYLDGAGETGLGVPPLPFFDERAKPHPLGTLVQRIRLTGAWRRVPVKHFVAATARAGHSPFADTTERLQADPEFTVHVWDVRHNVLAEGPDRVLALLDGLSPRQVRGSSGEPGDSRSGGRDAEGTG
jgi:pimeloyl-ACP methyl ester carboxylesterase